MCPSAVMAYPVSKTLHTTGTYTVPAGRVAKCRLNVAATGTIKINGVNFMVGATHAYMLPGAKNLYPWKDSTAATDHRVFPTVNVTAPGVYAEENTEEIFSSNNDSRYDFGEVVLQSGDTLQVTGLSKAYIEEYTL